MLDGRICYVGPSAKHTRGEATEILDAARMLHFARLYRRSHAYRSLRPAV